MTEQDKQRIDRSAELYSDRVVVQHITVAMDSKNIKDYLHLYLGCSTDKGKLIGIELNKAVCMMDDLSIVEGNIYSLKPILRPLSDMTEEERAHINGMEQNNSSYPTMAYALAPHFHYLLSKGFDLFGLIDAGLAIKKSD